MGPKTNYYLAAVLVLCVALGLAACGPDEQLSAPEDGEEGDSAPAPRTQGQEEQPATQEQTREQTREEEPPPEQASSELEELLAEDGASGADGYATVTDGAGALRLEIPLGWDHATGEESETGEGGLNWSDFAGEGHKASITAAPTLDAWHTAGGVPGVYVVASKGLAQAYTDEQLVASGPFDLSAACEPGARSDFGRPPYTGRMQAWRNCEVDAEATFLTLSAVPEGRECVVLMQLAMYGEADVEIGQHILESFEVECAAAASYPLAVADGQYVPGQYTPDPNVPSPNLPDPGVRPAPGGPDPYGDWTCDEIGGGPYPVPPGSPHDEDGDGLACE